MLDVFCYLLKARFFCFLAWFGLLLALETFQGKILLISTEKIVRENLD